MILLNVKNWTSKMTKYTKEQVFVEFNAKVRNYIIGKVNNYHLAEDICSEVFDKVYSKLDSFNSSKASISTWIFTIARNTLIDYYRTRKVDLELNDDIDMEVEEDDEEGLICNKENLEKLSNALKKLSDKEKQVIVFHYYDGKSLKDVAVFMKISYPYAKIIHRAALLKLKNELL